MSAPYELMAGPFTAWLATARTALPVDLDAAPPVAWTKVGTGGSKDYSEDGVVISNEQALEYFRGLGGTGRRKAWRTEEDPMVSFTVHDSRPEVVRYALNSNALTSTAAGASTSGAKSVDLYRGPSVTQHALLLRSDDGSPYGDEFIAQFWMPLVVIENAMELTYEKGVPAGVAFEFAVLQDDTDDFGEFRAQNAVKTS